MRRVGALSVVLAATAGLLVSGCGGGTRQDAQEPKGTFRVRIVRASFPALQAIARPTNLELQVRNTGTPHRAERGGHDRLLLLRRQLPRTWRPTRRPIWVVEPGPGTIPKRLVQSQVISPPGGGQTAYVNTWALGPLAPGRTRTFLWQVAPVKGGLHTVHFTIAAGLAGKATPSWPAAPR